MSVAKKKQEINRLFREERTACGDHIDHVFYANFEGGQSYCVPVPTYDDHPKNYNDEKQVKSYVMRHLNEGPAFASDHQPIITVLKTRKP